MWTFKKEKIFLLDDAHRDTIIEAMRQLADVLHCVKFGVFNKGAQPSGDYIHIVNKEECWSFIGKRGGRQVHTFRTLSLRLTILITNLNH